MEKPIKKPAGHEDEISANDENKVRKVDSFKTGDKKQARYFDQPFDEQMHDPKPLADDDDDESG